MTINNILFKHKHIGDNVFVFIYYIYNNVNNIRLSFHTGFLWYKTLIVNFANDSNGESIYIYIYRIIRFNNTPNSNSKYGGDIFLQ